MIGGGAELLLDVGEVVEVDERLLLHDPLSYEEDEDETGDDDARDELAFENVEEQTIEDR